MNTKKKILLIAAAVLVILLGAGGTIAAISLIGAKDNDTAKQDETLNDEHQSASADAMQKGYKAESSGDAKEALEHYTDANKACKENDDLCKADTSTKMQIMDIIVSGKKSNTSAPQVPEGAPTPVPSPTPAPVSTPPAPMPSDLPKSQPINEKPTPQN